MAKTNLLVVLAGDNKALLSSLKQARRQLDEFGSTVSSLGTVLSATLTPAIVGLGAAALKIAGDFEQSEIAFETMLGTAEKAQAFLEDLADFAKRTPFDLAGLQDAAKRLLAMGFAADDVLPTLEAVGDATAAIGGGKEVIDGVTLALGQMRAKAKVSAEEMKQLAERGIPAWEILATKMGVDIPTAMKLAEKGAIDGIKAVEALVQGLNDKFAGTMERQANTLIGQVERVKDEAMLLLRDIGQVLAPFVQPILDAVSQLIGWVSGLVQEFKELDPAIQKAIVAFVAFAAAIGPILVVLGGIATAIASVAALAPEVIAAVAGIGVAMAGAGGALFAYWEDFKGFAQWLVDAFPVAVEVVKAAVVILIEAFKALADSFPGEVLIAIVEDTVDRIKLILSALGAAFDIVLDGFVVIVDALAKINPKIRAAVMDVKRAIADFELKRTFIEEIEKPSESAIDKIGKLGDGFRDQKPKLEDFLRSAEGAGKAVREKVNPAIETLVKIMSDSKSQELARNLEAVRNRTGEFAVVLSDEVAPAMERVNVATREVASIVEQKLSLAFKQIAADLDETKNHAKVLGISLEADIVARLEIAKSSFAELEKAAEASAATERDVMFARIALLQQWKDAAKQGVAEWSEALETELNDRLEQTQNFVKESEDAWTTLGNQISTILTDLSSSIADAIIGAQSLSDAFVNAAKAIGEAILRTIVEGAMKELLASILENDAAVGNLIEAFKKFIGIFTGGGGGGPKIPGTGGGSGGGGNNPFGSFGGVLEALDSLVSIVTNLINMFTMRRIEKDVGRIEVTTREIKAETMNRRDDAWAQHNEVLGKWDLSIQALWDILDLFKNSSSPTLPTSSGAADLQPVIDAVNRVGDILNDWRLDFSSWSTSQFAPLSQEIVRQTGIFEQMAADLAEIADVFTLIASGTKSNPFANPSAATMAGASSGPLIGTLNLNNGDPIAVGRAIGEALRSRGNLRSEGFELNF